MSFKILALSFFGNVIFLIEEKLAVKFSDLKSFDKYIHPHNHFSYQDRELLTPVKI